MSPSVTPERYPIAIVGGGIAGLTLALALEKLGVRYVLFESQSSLAPDRGASVGLQPNGLRILDQLGLIDKIEQHTGTLQRWRHLDGQGELISETKALGYYQSLIGYGPLFLERRKLLEIMADELQDKTAAKTSLRVVSANESSDGVELALSDGHSITADLVIGADGVRSCIREAIDMSRTEWHSEANEYINTQFACVYGISGAIQGIVEGDCFSVYRPEATVLIFTGRNGTIFWFVFEDLGQTYGLSTTPRYTNDDFDALCDSIAHLRLTASVRFGDVYGNRSVAMKVPLEEGLAPSWHTDRMVIVGDAAHKMVPNAAMGANQAIESSATLLNELGNIFTAKDGGSPQPEILANALKRYADIRKFRASEIVKRAGTICRAQLSHSGPAAAVREELPSLTDGDWLFRGFMSLSESPVIDALPVPPRGKFFGQAVEKFWKSFRARQASGFKTSNLELFGIEA
ncbi:3-hydroxybenzoate 6-hydroxylase 1 [Penicillium brasilianum]|uniref:3-hydroxybenzoate 6-hydroxylase 1 n=1 Tax=Penicillium brasilianum TaxID=104259 RepID=A0A1S9RS84_PENBI|nr:3-hydroxybenzoate 6-hydroxylase 1 [Penicillium brasilianum]